MCELFSCREVQTLFSNTNVVIMGDSIQRGIYKELVKFYQSNAMLTDKDLRAKGEMSFMGDHLLEGGQLNELHNGPSYREVREYKSDDNFYIRFYFITRIYGDYMQAILETLRQCPPHVMIVNSTLWDITRYGASSIPDYCKNMQRFLGHLTDVLPQRSMFIWNTAMPISNDCRGGFLTGVEKSEAFQSRLRMNILMANMKTCAMVSEAGFDVLDLHYFMMEQLHHRAADGIHWDPFVHRRISNVLLTHLVEAFSMPLPVSLNPMIQEFYEMVANKELDSQSPSSPSPSIRSIRSRNEDIPPIRSRNENIPPIRFRIGNSRKRPAESNAGPSNAKIAKTRPSPRPLKHWQRPFKPIIRTFQKFKNRFK